MLTATEYALAPFAAVGLVTIVSKLHDTFRFFLRPPGYPGPDGESGPSPSARPYCYGSFEEGGVARERDCRMCGSLDRCFAESKPLWAKKDRYVTEQNPPLRQVPPNMGSDAVPYAGPNYVSDDDLAEEMKGLIHFFGEPEPGYFDDPARLGHRLGGDLAWDFKGYGLVAADGSIWVAPDERVHSGIVLMQASEMGKAARFGWTYERESNGNSDLVWVRREHGA